MSAVFSDAATMPRPSTSRPRLNLGALRELLQPSHDERARRLQSILDELDELRHNQDRDGYIFRPTPYAFEHARRWMISAHSLVEQELPSPTFVPDGEGGIDIEWVAGGCEVSLSCRAFPTLKGNYIYWQDTDDYDAETVTLSGLLERLSWLLDSNR
jgi:hypothetical protein